MFKEKSELQESDPITWNRKGYKGNLASQVTIFFKL